MSEELRILSDLLDYPVVVLGFAWALRMIREMYCDMQEMLERCLDKEE